MLTISEIRTAVAKIAPEYPIKKVQLFGSYANGSATPESDVDVLVEFRQRPITLLDFYGFQQDLSDILETKVDVLQLPASQSINKGFKINKTVSLYG